MKHVLHDILAQKRHEVEERQGLFPVKLLEKSPYFSTTPVSLRSYLKRPDKVGVIAEIKRKSPSKGILHKHVNVEALSLGYMQAGASALSVLTDTPFFGGTLEDLVTARRFNFCPILRKDFIIDPYQVIEAKAKGADVILLIAAALDPERTEQLAQLARSLGMEVLLEVHSEEEVASHASEHIDLVGVNNRDLGTFEVSTETSLRLADKIPADFMKISESGINDAETISRLHAAGYRGFLIGETFMKSAHPAVACRKLIEKVKVLRS